MSRKASRYQESPNRMSLSWALYGGIVVLVLSLVPVIHPLRSLGMTDRLPAVVAICIALVLILTGVFTPARTHRTNSARTELDRIVPVFQFVEFHDTFVDAPPERAHAAMKAVTAEEIRFYRTLVGIRRCGDNEVSILNPPRGEPIIDVAARTGFQKLIDEPDELVIGMYVIPKRAFAAMNFTLTPEGRGSRVTTETRVFASDARALRRFTMYWRFIHPGSAIIRRGWLAAIKRRAESLELP